MSATDSRTKDRLPLPLGSSVDNRYELLSVLGVGGFGVVYKAKQETTGQLVALKVLRGGNLNLEGSVEAARFEREMKLIGRIKHPHIVRLIDFGRLDGGLIYMVLEYVEGETLAALLRREGGLRPREAKRFMSQVLFALHAVHEHGVVYRDLKPANIMITATGSHRDATILDFGISGLSDRNEGDSDIADLTVDGSIRGTPGYMAPELLTQQIATPQSDIYAWGLVFLETLISRRIMTADSSVEVMARQISDEPVPIPAEIIESPCGPIIEKAVAKDMRERWQSASEVIEYFEDCEMDPTFHLPWTGLPGMQALKQVASRPTLTTGDLGRGQTRSSELDSSLLEPLETEPAPPPEDSGRGVPAAIGIGVIAVVGLVGLAISVRSDEPEPTPTIEPVPAEVVTAPAEPEEDPVLLINLTAKPETAVFTYDGIQVGNGSLRREQKVDGKTHVIRVQAPGFVPETFRFTDIAPSGVVALAALGTPEGARAEKREQERQEEERKQPRKRRRRRTAKPKPKSDPVAAAVEPAPEPTPVEPAAPAKTEAPEKAEKTPEEKAEKKPAKGFAPVVGDTTPDPWAEKKAVTPDPWAK